MNITPIAELRPGRYDYMICVRISRIWEFRGTNEDDNIKHLDLVLLDQKEGNIVYISKITVNNAKPSYRAVDVIGKIIAVSNAAMISTSSLDYRMRRIVKLQDLSGKTIDLSLSGKRAVEFDGETILEVGQNNHIIAIFVGTSMKILKGTYEFLSGTTACRWYINENDIPEIKMFQKCLPPHADPIQKLYLQSDEDMQRSIEHKTLAELKEIDPFVDKDEKYQCTATIIGIQERKTWCYQAYKLCNCKMIWDGSILKCKKENCPCRQYEYKYKIPFIANDGTASLELVLFEKKGTELIGRTAETMKRQYDINQTPPEIKAWIGHKFTFIVKVLPNITINADEPSFEVLTIKERFGRQHSSQGFKATKNLPISSSSSQQLHNLPPLVPILSKKIQHEIEPPHDIQSMEVEPYNLETSTLSGKRAYEDPNSTDQENDEEESTDYGFIQTKGKKKRST
ncbi:uncharacterized protein LOC127770843 [Oryza glaberrima]|uniref:uncharacterized protein LOC127770843 n=1 Tax=Oryza glaberrima TaxID=4538 RepID=UPI00224C1869|nr:uncharacterized protein LOC127770843 [Oryza glaberrima]